MGKTRYRSIRNRKKSKKRRTKSKKRIGRGKNTLKPNRKSVIDASKLTNKLIHDENFTDSESSLSPDSETKSPQRTKSKTADDRAIGMGGFSHVFSDGKKEYALKFSGYKTWNDFNGEDKNVFKKEMVNEVKMQKELAHKGISLDIDFTGFVEDDVDLWHYSIMKRADGDIRHFINLIIEMRADINIDEIVEKITTLYDNLHKLNYTHGDIRPGNIVYILEDKKDINSVKFYLIDFNFTAKSNEYIEREKKELIKDVIIPLRTRITEGRMCDLSKPFIN